MDAKTMGEILNARRGIDSKKEGEKVEKRKGLHCE
jgi:hypothetical protein